MTDEVPTPDTAAPDTTGKVALTKAEKLEAKAARLREAEIARAQAAASAPAGTARRFPVLWIVATGVLVVLLVLTVLYGLNERSKVSHDARLNALRASVIKTATTVAASFGTYDYKTLDADFARTKAYLTPAFAADFGQLTASLGSLISQDKGQTIGTVTGVGVESLAPPTAIVVVFLDQKVTTAESSTPRIDHNRVKLTLALQSNGRWLVSKLSLV
jgi:Mce-associated membrane protein